METAKIRKLDPKKCSGPLWHNCKNCIHFEECKKQLFWYNRIPYQIQDYVQPRLSRPAWSIFTYLNRISTFDPHSQFHSRTRAAYDQIEQATGVKTVSKYLKELVRIRLITHRQARELNTDGNWVTLNYFTITWRIKWKEQLGTSK